MNTRNLIVFSLLALLIGVSSCRDDFDFEIASDNLSFSRDTVDLDTIFNYTNSQTYKLTLHNNQDEDIQIPKVYLSRGNESFFKLNVDGIPGHDFENIAVRKNDSIFIFIEIAAGEAPINPLYEDEINFETNNGTQQVKLISHIERAQFYNTDQEDNFSLGSVNWDNNFSRVIFGNVNADNVNINAGTKVYFHNNASLTINGSLNVTGTKENRVIFRSDRMDERSDSIPNLWGKIKLKSPNNSVVNSVNYAVIKGGNIGLEVENSFLNISNTKIINNEQFGLVGINSTINGRNLVVNNADLAALALEGGAYDFRHCTFANYFNIGMGAGENFSLFLSNDGYPLTKANFYNNIIYGRSSQSIYFDNVNNNAFSYQFDFNVIRLDPPNELPTGNFTNTLILPTSDILFVESEDLLNDLRILLESPAIGHANYNYVESDELNALNQDILGDNRTNSGLNPGAYQTVVDPETLD